MQSKKSLIIFSLATLMLVLGYGYFALQNKRLMHKIPNGVYNIKRISCPEDLDLTNPLISRELTTHDFGMTFSHSLDFDDIVKRQLIINDGDGRVILESKNCSSMARFRISKNTGYRMHFDFENIKLHTKGSCRFKKTYKGKIYEINQFGHFAHENRFLESYWYDLNTPEIEWSLYNINNRIIIEAKFKQFSDIPCPKQNKIVWEIEKSKI